LNQTGNGARDDKATHYDSFAIKYLG
jgi:hypothetical protein